jgi:hypothetical protein
MYENECMREYIKYTIIGLYMLPLLFLQKLLYSFYYLFVIEFFVNYTSTFIYNKN